MTCHHCLAQPRLAAYEDAVFGRQASDEHVRGGARGRVARADVGAGRSAPSSAETSFAFFWRSAFPEAFPEVCSRRAARCVHREEPGADAARVPKRVRFADAPAGRAPRARRTGDGDDAHPDATRRRSRARGLARSRARAPPRVGGARVGEPGDGGAVRRRPRRARGGPAARRVASALPGTARREDEQARVLAATSSASANGKPENVSRTSNATFECPVCQEDADGSTAAAELAVLPCGAQAVRVLHGRAGLARAAATEQQAPQELQVPHLPRADARGRDQLRVVGGRARGAEPL